MTHRVRSRLWIMSDLHQESPRLAWTPPDDVVHDVVVLAGDIHGSTRNALDWATASFAGPVVCVAGNHEFYGHGIRAGIEDGHRTSAASDRVRFLENATTLIGGVRFVGCTLWSDFDLLGPGTRRTAMRTAVREMSDFDQILLDEPRNGMMSPRFLPSHARAMHVESRRFVEEELAKPFDGPTVVVTHHAPSGGSIHPRFADDPLTACFVSDLEEVVLRHGPEVWIHGHVHDAFDYSLGRTRVLCNPKGYEKERPGFDPRLVVEI